MSFEFEKRSFSLWESLRKGPLKIFFIGGGNWGTVISRIASRNAKEAYIFDDTVYLWIHEEIFQGKSLTETINTQHENPKYLPGVKLPENLIAVSQLLPYASEADLIVFVIPHQFVERVCKQLSGKVKASAQAISLLKGIKVNDGQPVLYSSIIEHNLGVPCSVMSGANVANDIAREDFSETTLGYKPENRENAAIWQQLFDTPYYKVSGVPDICGVEVSGAVKNIVALSVGFCDALKYGTNTKAALMRIGVEEIKLFANLFFSGIKEETFFDSAGYADVITTCFGGRNARCAAEFVRRQGKDSWEKIETDLLKGQKLQGHLTAKEIYEAIHKHKLEDLFPLFTVTYRIAFEQEPPSSLINCFMTSDVRQLKSWTECNTCLVPDYIQRIRSLVSPHSHTMDSHAAREDCQL